MATARPWPKYQTEMFMRKLKALEYPESGFFNPDDQTSVRSLVIWLEDRVFNTELSRELSGNLRNAQHPAWNSVFVEYLALCQCPFDAIKDRPAMLDWLLHEAIRLVGVGENYQLEGKSIRQNGVSFGNVDFASREFHEGSLKMAAMLHVRQHPDLAVVLQSVGNLLSDRLSRGGKAANNENFPPYPLEEVTLGFDNADEKLRTACRILRLLHVKQLRQLQTQMDTALVAVQTITADPKTDSGLGRTGY